MDYSQPISKELQGKLERAYCLETRPYNQAGKWCKPNEEWLLRRFRGTSCLWISGAKALLKHFFVALLGLYAKYHSIAWMKIYVSTSFSVISGPNPTPEPNPSQGARLTGVPNAWIYSIALLYSGISLFAHVIFSCTFSMLLLYLSHGSHSHTFPMARFVATFDFCRFLSWFPTTFAVSCHGSQKSILVPKNLVIFQQVILAQCRHPLFSHYHHPMLVPLKQPLNIILSSHPIIIYHPMITPHHISKWGSVIPWLLPWCSAVASMHASWALIASLPMERHGTGRMGASTLGGGWNL